MKKYALIIGNNQYDDPLLTRLKTPEADVQALVSVLGDKKIGEFDEVIPWVNKTERETRRKVENFLKGRKHDDLVLIYFSGHGIKSDQGHLYFAFKDTEKDSLMGTAISSDFIDSVLKYCLSKRKILVLDCCYSGAFERGTKAGDNIVMTKDTFEGFGSVVITSSNATQYAWEGDQIIGNSELSLFTHYLLEGLETGNADLNGDGEVTIQEWYSYTYSRVVKQTPKQTPRMWGDDLEGQFLVAKNPSVKGSLPKEIIVLIKSPYPKLRLIAAGQLGELLSSRDTDQAQDARRILENLAKDEAYEVASEAQKQILNFEKLIKDRDAAEKAARYKAEKEAAEKARLKANEEERQRIAKEKAEREAASERVSLLRNKFNKVTQLERSGYLEDALNICYEIKAMDRKYPSIEKKIQEIQKAIKLRDDQKKEEERQRIAKEKADREAAEKARLIAEEEERKKIAREKAELEETEKTAREKAKKEADELATLFNKAIQLERSGYLEESLSIYYEIKSFDSQYPNVEKKIRILEKAISEVQKKEADEQARLKAKEEQQRIAKEKAERETAGKARLLANILHEKTNRAINLENSGSLDAALNVYYEIRSFDPHYPNAEKKIQEIEKTIRFREKAEKEFAEQVRLKREEERQRIAKKRVQGLYWLGSITFIILGIVLISSLNIPLRSVEPTPSNSLLQAVFTSTSTELVEPAVTSNPVPTSTPMPASPPVIIALTPTPLPTEITDAKGIVMRLVPSGYFIMGGEKYADERPVQSITLDEYYIDKYEVTNGAYQLCVNSGVCEAPEMASSSTRPSYYDNSQFSEYPVIYVNWYMAETYCKWREGKLPTNAEWEKAARGIDGRIYPWGEEISCEYANYKSDCAGDIVEIGSYPGDASYYGLYDITGNVAEWVNEGHDYQAFAYNPWDIQVFKAVRGTKGGSWSFGSIIARLPYRNWLSPNSANYDVGIRCAKDVEP